MHNICPADSMMVNLVLERFDQTWYLSCRTYHITHEFWELDWVHETLTTNRRGLSRRWINSSFTGYEIMSLAQPTQVFYNLNAAFEALKTEYSDAKGMLYSEGQSCVLVSVRVHCRKENIDDLDDIQIPIAIEELPAREWVYHEEYFNCCHPVRGYEQLWVTECLKQDLIAKVEQATMPDNPFTISTSPMEDIIDAQNIV